MKAVMLGYWVIFLGVVLQVFGLLWDLELPPIGWQLFILGSSQSYSTAFPTFLDTCATRLLAEPLSLRNGETVWVVAHHQQMTESQKTVLAQGRVSVARSPGEFNSAFFFGHEEGVSFYLVVSDKGLPSTPEGW